MEVAKLKYPVGVQSFQRIRTEGFVYIDKTPYILKLLETPIYYFLSRPRRFGKSLLINTLEAYFNGRRDLFKGLAIDRDDVDWEPRPVIKMSLSKLDPKSEEDLWQAINFILSNYEEEYGTMKGITSLSQRFEHLIQTAYEHTGRQVVILIDEYDNPLLSTLRNPELNSSFRATLKSLFTVVKDLSDYVYFEMVTGVSRFSQTSLFSGANNLKDITLLDEYAGICGITEEEFHRDLSAGVSIFAKKNEDSVKEAFAELKRSYDGYHFSATGPDVYNPFSLLNALQDSKVSDYWFQSGTPQYLLDIVQEEDFFMPDLECTDVSAHSLSSIESYVGNPVALMFESGYLTIKSYDKELDAFVLGLPNEEVAIAFSKALLPIYSGLRRTAIDNDLIKMRAAIIKGDPTMFIDRLKTFLSGNPYSNTELKERETYFKNNIYLVLKALGFHPYAELQTCSARMDLMLETRKYIYIFELKVNKDPETALDQIEEKKYAAPWKYSGKPVIKIGANYDSKTNNIEMLYTSTPAN